MIERLFAAYRPAVQAAALEHLGRLGDARALVRIALAHADSLEQLPLEAFEAVPAHGPVLFPALLALLDRPALEEDLLHALLAHLDAGHVQAADLAAAAPAILARAADAVEAATASLARGRFSPEHLEPRERAGLLLDVAARLGGPGAAPLARAAADHPDPLVATWAVDALVRLGEAPPPAALARTAADLETRALLFERLDAAGRRELFPAAHGTQVAIAASQLARWIEDRGPTGAPPVALEHVEVVTIDTGAAAGLVDYHVFRFLHAVDGEPTWVAGVAGGYRRDRAPTLEHDGEVGSAFEPFDDQRPAAHVGDLEALRARWTDPAADP